MPDKTGFEVSVGFNLIGRVNVEFSARGSFPGFGVNSPVWEIVINESGIIRAQPGNARETLCRRFNDVNGSGSLYSFAVLFPFLNRFF